MTTRISLSPLFGSTVGFDRFDSLFERLGRTLANDDSFPPYDIERIGEDAYGITLAVAGYKENEIGLTVHDTQLIVTGHKDKPESRDKTYLYKGIALRGFEQVFQLAPYVSVKDAELKDGLLRIHLVRELPEAQKPRQIEICTKEEPRSITAQTANAA